MTLVENVGLADLDMETLGEASTQISGITIDSRAVQDGDLYCCIRGSHFDGYGFIGEAIDRGAAAVLREQAVPLSDLLTVPQIVVKETRSAIGPLSAAFYEHPSNDLRVVGVTGTNGKTTVTYLLKAILEAHGLGTEIIGTLNGARTTPEAPVLQQRLAQARDRGDKAIAMEVSSHALDQRRVDGTNFAAAVFTNLSHEHENYHGSMQNYFEAKARLFRPEFSRHAVINIDDAYGAQLVDRVRRADNGVSVDMFSLDEVSDLNVDREGSSFVWDGHRIRLKLIGAFNVANAVAAAHVGRLLGVPSADAADALSGVSGVPGRFELVDQNQPFTVVVDFAHTPAGLENLLAAGRALLDSQPTGGSLIVVFGCGGGRDSAKRPLMGATAARLADTVVLTSDNPRDEAPLEIIAEIREGIDPSRSAARVIVEVDRALAVDEAIGSARPGDVVMLAGKGHETTQDLGTTSTSFDDRVVARAALQRRKFT